MCFRPLAVHLQSASGRGARPALEHGHSFRRKTQTAMINMVVKRMLNNVHLLDVSYVTTYIFRSDR